MQNHSAYTLYIVSIHMLLSEIWPNNCQHSYHQYAVQHCTPHRKTLISSLTNTKRMYGEYPPFKWHHSPSLMLGSEQECALPAVWMSPSLYRHDLFCTLVSLQARLHFVRKAFWGDAELVVQTGTEYNRSMSSFDLHESSYGIHGTKCGNSRYPRRENGWSLNCATWLIYA